MARCIGLENYMLQRGEAIPLLLHGTKNKDWVAYWSDEYRQCYYANKKKNKVQWEPPASFSMNNPKYHTAHHLKKCTRDLPVIEISAPQRAQLERFGEKNATKDAEIRVAQMSSVHQKILAIEKKMAALGHERIRLMTQCDREMKTHVAATHASTIVLRNNHNENPTTCPLWYTLSHSDDIMFTSMDHLDVLSLRNLRQVSVFMRSACDKYREHRQRSKEPSMRQKLLWFFEEGDHATCVTCGQRLMAPVRCNVMKCPKCGHISAADAGAAGPVDR